MFYYFCGDAACNGVCGHVFRNDGSRRNNCIVADSYARKYRCVCAYPYAVPDFYGRGEHIRAFAWGKVVVYRSDYNLLSDKYVISDFDSALFILIFYYPLDYMSNAYIL